MAQGLSLRLVKPAELDAVAQFWTADIGIPVEVRLFKRWYTVDPEAFRIVIDKNNRIVASASVVKQSDGLFVLGYLSVSKEYRGKGIGRMLLANMIQRCPTANFVLNVNAEKLQMFEERGFKKDGEGNAYAYIGRFVNQFDEKVNRPTDVVVIKATAGDCNMADLTAYDRMVNGFQRNVGALVLDSPDSTVMLAKQGGKIVGYGKIQPYVQAGAWVGPLYADNINLARYLIDALLRCYADKKCSILFCILSQKGQSLAPSLGLKLIDKLNRCCLRLGQAALPPLRLDKVFVFDDPGLAFL